MKNITYTHTVPGYLLKPQHPVTINLIGCGGTGSQLLTHLARIDFTLRAGGLGFGTHPGLHVRAFDGDTVSEANIGRQNFAPSDVGQNKAVVLITRINRFYGQNWEAHPYMYDESVIAKDLHRVNIIITCVDSAKARITIAKINKQKPVPIKKEVGQTTGRWTELPYFQNTERNTHAYQRQYYWLDLGNGRNSGQVVLGSLSTVKQPEGLAGTIDKLPTILDLFPNLEAHDTEEEQGHSCSVAESINSQDLCTNSQMAEWGKKLIWNIFRKMRLETHGVFINLDQMCVNPLPIKNANVRRPVKMGKRSRRISHRPARKPIQNKRVQRKAKRKNARRKKN